MSQFKNSLNLNYDYNKEHLKQVLKYLFKFDHQLRHVNLRFFYTQLKGEKIENEFN